MTTANHNFKKASADLIRRRPQFQTVTGHTFAGETFKGVSAMPIDHHWVFNGFLVPSGNGEVTIDGQTLNRATGEVTDADYNLTEKETAVLKAAGDYLSSYRVGEPGFSDLMTDDLVASTGYTTERVKGVLSSLIEKGLIDSEDIDPDLKAQHVADLGRVLTTTWLHVSDEGWVAYDKIEGAIPKEIPLYGKHFFTDNEAIAVRVSTVVKARFGYSTDLGKSGPGWRVTYWAPQTELDTIEIYIEGLAEGYKNPI